jgi:quinol monooxygenase YgiN
MANQMALKALGRDRPAGLERWHVSGIGPAMVFASIRFFPGPKERAQLLEILQSVQDLTIVRTGCLGCWLSQEDSPHAHVRYTEQWESEETLYDHIHSELYRRILAAMELSRRPPEVQFHYVGATKGMELIEAVRSAASASNSEI